MSSAAVSEAPVQIDKTARTQIVVAVMLGLFLSALDQTIVGTALPRIISDLRGNELYAWAFTAYIVTATISGPIYGKLSDLFGRRPILLVAVSIFLVGSLLSGLSQDMWQLIAFRAFQGLGAGALFPVAMAVIGDLFEPHERGKYQGLFGAVFGLSSLIGPGIGGLITDTIGWQWVFFVNLPVGAVVLAVVWRNLPRKVRSGPAPSIDYLGTSLLVGALVPILIGLTNKQFAEWSDPTVGGFIAAGMVLAAGFVFVESRAKEPIVPLDLFRIPAFTLGVSAMFLVTFAFFAPVVFLPRWFQVVNGSSATESGYQILALLGGLIISAIGAGQLVARTRRYKPFVIASPALLAAGLFMLTNLRADTPIPLLWVWMFVTGLGVGPAFAVFTLVVQASVPMRQIGTASSTLGLFQQVGGTIGLAITGTAFGTRFIAEVPRQLAASNVPAPIQAGFASAGAGQFDQLTRVGDLGQTILASVPEAVRGQVEPFVPDIVNAVHAAFSIATASAFELGIISAVAALALVVFLPEPKMAVPHFEPAPADGRQLVPEASAE